MNLVKKIYIYIISEKYQKYSLLILYLKVLLIFLKIRYFYYYFKNILQ